MDYEAARAFALAHLGEKLPSGLTYHGLQHTLDVLAAAERLAGQEGLTGRDLTLLRTAALLHDAGITRARDGHEAESVALAAERLPGFGYTEADIEHIGRMILATRLPQAPGDPLSEILCDADLDYLGRDDYTAVASGLRAELETEQGPIDEEEWVETQIRFIEAHTYFTMAARTARDVGKRAALEDLLKRRSSTAILFADISKSTWLYELLGDEAAQGLVDRCITLMLREAGRRGGTMVKSIGDEILCTFPTALDASLAAVGMQEAVNTLPVMDPLGHRKPNIHVGIHFGPVVRKDGDIFGDAVNVAARLTSLARARQIFISGDTVKALPPDHGLALRFVERTTVKGKSSSIEVHEAVWENDDQTVQIEAGIRAAPVFRQTLTLTVGDCEVRVSESRPVVTIGRQPHNDLQVSDTSASRTHARVEHRSGKFLIVDESRNGTFVQPCDGEEIVLRRTDTTLRDEGVIGLGRRVTPADRLAVQYRIREEA